MCGEFLFHIPWWLHFYLGSFSYTSRPSFTFLWVVSLTDVMLALLFCGEFLLHIPCWFHFYRSSFSRTSRAGFSFIWEVSITHHMLDLLFCGEFLLHIPGWFLFFSFFVFVLFFNLGSFSYTSRAGFIFIWGVSLTHSELGSLSSGEILLHILLASFLCGEFLFHLQCWL